MDKNAKTGRKGEIVAVEYLKKKDFQILEQNYRYRHSEIDIIATINDLLVFVEVKTRSSVDFGFPEEAVNRQKTANVKRGALYYIYKENWQHDIRFDIVSVHKNGGKYEIVHFEDAFS